MSELVADTAIRRGLHAVTLQVPALDTATAMQRADRAQAIVDLQTDARFTPIGHDADAPYDLHLAIVQSRLMVEVRHADGRPCMIYGLSLGPLRSVVKDYRMLVDSHEHALAEGREARIQAIDMGRRGLHDEGAAIVRDRLAGKIDVDFPTARRLFTLICVLLQRD